MKILGAIALALLVGCATDPSTSSTSANDTAGTLTEPVLVNNHLCQITFLGTSAPNHDTFFIWNMGVGSWLHDATYPSDSRPDLYAIFAPAPANETHHVDGWDQFDHYHVVTAGPGDPGYDTTFDVWLVFPGPNFDPNTYTVATNPAAVQAQIAAGILGAPLRTTDAGFQPLVLRVPINHCN